jgi:hypothetical protein
VETVSESYELENPVKEIKTIAESTLKKKDKKSGPSSTQLAKLEH